MSEADPDRIDRLESLVATQQAQIDALQERVATLTGGDDPGLTRRAALSGAGLVGLLGLGTGGALADPQGQVGTAADPVTALYAQELNGALTNGSALTQLAGEGLSIDTGRLNVSGADLLAFGGATGVIAETFGGLAVNAPSAGEVTVPAGTGFVADDATGASRRVAWPETVLGPLGADSNVRIGIDNAGTPTTGVAGSPTTILLGAVVTDSNSRIVVTKRVPDVVDHNGSRLERAVRLGAKNVVSSGLVTSKNAGNPGQLDVSPGTYLYGSHVYTPAGGTSVEWGEYYTDNNANTALRDESLTKNTVPAAINVPGPSGPLIPVPSGEFARHGFYVVGEGSTEQYLLVYGETSYTTLTNARDAAPPPRPELLAENVAFIASVIVDDAGAIQEIVDERRTA